MDIPIELFVVWIGISLALVGIGFAFRPRIPIFIMVAGIFLFPFIAMTDKITMGYEANIATTYNNVTDTIHEDIESYEPKEFIFDEWPKIFFGIYASTLTFIGALVYQKEK